MITVKEIDELITKTKELDLPMQLVRCWSGMQELAQIAKRNTERAIAAEERVAELEEFREKAFEAYPNIDIDIEHINFIEEDL